MLLSQAAAAAAKRCPPLAAILQRQWQQHSCQQCRSPGSLAAVGGHSSSSTSTSTSSSMDLRAAGPLQSRLSTTAAAAAAAAAAAPGPKPGEAFLASLIDYEKLGVPKAAGVAPGSSSSSSSSSGSGAHGDTSSISRDCASRGAGFDLQRMHRLLSALGSPQQQLRVVHVAGTKGKGSVVAMISEILRAAGLKIGTYSSPHFFDIRERVVVGGGSSGSGSSSSSSPAAAAAAAVSEEDWEALALQAQAAVHSMQQPQTATAAPVSSSSSSSETPSHFEVVTAMALKHFAQQQVDVAVIETGVGGATDATNVFGPQQLQAAVLTAVGLDHVEALGGSLRSIAAAKAGIMKPGVPVVVGPQGLSSQPLAGELQQQQQQQQDGSGESAAAAGAESPADVVWGAIRRHAEQPGMQCPVLDAAAAVQVSQASCSPGIAILPGTGPNLARQTLDITAHPLNPASSAHCHSVTSAAAAAAAAKPQEQRELTQMQQQQPTSTAHAGDSEDQGGYGSGDGSPLMNLSAVQVQLVGSHQADNVQTAVAAALLLRQHGWSSITPAAIRSGLQEAWLPGRFQVAQLPGSSHCHVVLDAAHTAESAAALAATLRSAFPTQPLVLLLAMAADKQHREVCEALRACQPAVVIFTTVPIAGSHHRAAPPGTLAGHWQAAAMLPSSGRPLRCRELIQANLGAALDKARHELGAHSSRGGVVAVTGSLHAVAAAMKQLGLAGS